MAKIELRPLQRPPELRVAREDVVETLGGRTWRFYRVFPSDIRLGDALADEPGWYFNAVRPHPLWLNNNLTGPYASLDEAREDAALAAAAEAG